MGIEPTQAIISRRTDTTAFDQVYTGQRRRPATVSLNVQWIPVPQRSGAYRWIGNDETTRKVKTVTFFGTGEMRGQQIKATTPPNSDYTDAYLSAFSTKTMPRERIDRTTSTVFTKIAPIPLKPVSTPLSPTSSIQTSQTRLTSSSINTNPTLSSLNESSPSASSRSSTYSSSFVSDKLKSNETLSSALYSQSDGPKYVSNYSTTLRASPLLPTTSTITATGINFNSTIVDSQSSSDLQTRAAPSFATIRRTDSTYDNIYKPLPPYSIQAYPPKEVADTILSSTLSTRTSSAYKPYVPFQSVPGVSPTLTSSVDRSLSSASYSSKSSERPETLSFQSNNDQQSSTAETTPTESVKISSELQHVETEDITMTASKPIEMMKDTINKYDSLINQIAEVLASVSPSSFANNNDSSSKIVPDYQLSSDNSSMVEDITNEAETLSTSSNPFTDAIGSRNQAVHLIREDSYDKIVNAMSDLEQELLPVVDLSSMSIVPADDILATATVIDETAIPDVLVESQDQLNSSLDECVEPETSTIIEENKTATTLAPENTIPADIPVIGDIIADRIDAQTEPLVAEKTIQQKEESLLSTIPSDVHHAEEQIENADKQTDQVVTIQQVLPEDISLTINKKCDKHVRWSDSVEDNEDDDQSSEMEVEDSNVIDTMVSSESEHQLSTAESTIDEAVSSIVLEQTITENVTVQPKSIDSPIVEPGQQSESKTAVAISQVDESSLSENRNVETILEPQDAQLVSTIDSVTDVPASFDETAKTVEKSSILSLPDNEQHTSTGESSTVGLETLVEQSPVSIVPKAIQLQQVIESPIENLPDSISNRYISSDVYHGYLGHHQSYAKDLADYENDYSKDVLLASLKDTIDRLSVPLIEEIQSVISDGQTIESSVSLEMESIDLVQDNQIEIQTEAKDQNEIREESSLTSENNFTTDGESLLETVPASLSIPADAIPSASNVEILSSDEIIDRSDLNETTETIIESPTDSQSEVIVDHMSRQNDVHVDQSSASTISQTDEEPQLQAEMKTETDIQIDQSIKQIDETVLSTPEASSNIDTSVADVLHFDHISLAESGRATQDENMLPVLESSEVFKTENENLQLAIDTEPLQEDTNTADISSEMTVLAVSLEQSSVDQDVTTTTAHDEAAIEQVPFQEKSNTETKNEDVQINTADYSIKDIIANTVATEEQSSISQIDSTMGLVRELNSVDISEEQSTSSIVQSISFGDVCDTEAEKPSSGPAELVEASAIASMNNQQTNPEKFELQTEHALSANSTSEGLSSGITLENIVQIQSLTIEDTATDASTEMSSEIREKIQFNSIETEENPNASIELTVPSSNQLSEEELQIIHNTVTSLIDNAVEIILRQSHELLSDTQTSLHEDTSSMSTLASPITVIQIADQSESSQLTEHQEEKTESTAENAMIDSISDATWNDLVGDNISNATIEQSMPLHTESQMHDELFIIDKSSETTNNTEQQQQDIQIDGSGKVCEDQLDQVVISASTSDQSQFTETIRESSPTNTEDDSLELIHALQGHSIVLPSSSSLAVPGTAEDQNLNPTLEDVHDHNQFIREKSSSATTTSSQITSSDRYVSYAIHEMGDSSQERLPAFPIAADLPIYETVPRLSQDEKDNQAASELVVNTHEGLNKDEDLTELDATENLTSYSDDVLVQKLQQSAPGFLENLDATSSTDEDVDEENFNELEEQEVSNLERIIGEMNRQSSSLSGADGQAYHRYDLITTSSNSTESVSKAQTDDVYVIPGFPGLWRPSADDQSTHSAFANDADDDESQANDDQATSLTRVKMRTIVRTSNPVKSRALVVEEEQREKCSELSSGRAIDSSDVFNRPLNEFSFDVSETESYKTCASTINSSSVSKQQKSVDNDEQTKHASSDEKIYLIRERERGVSLPVTMKIDYDEMALRLSASTPIETPFYSDTKPDLPSPSTFSEPIPKTTSSSRASTPSLSSNESDQQKMVPSSSSWLNTVNTIMNIVDGPDGPLEAKTTIHKSAKGPISIAECDNQGRFVVVENTSRSKSIALAAWKLRQEMEHGETLIFTFPENALLRPNQSLKIFTKNTESERRSGDLVASSLSSWHTGSNVTTTLFNADGKDRASLTKKTVFS